MNACQGCAICSAPAGNNTHITGGNNINGCAQQYNNNDYSKDNPKGVFTYLKTFNIRLVGGGGFVLVLELVVKLPSNILPLFHHN